ncbi:hypothetical protein M8C21_029164 [Ambrosia artemisiifolia]|uniref:Cellulose synthase-like protein G2 n=1 Tax=Ambrosia artemisiifolia TaxID=4212 RepID=A0AAD5DBW4_AMBAR|nr:hypothetical protein M8C21_029164 [Ambrosia artemisiifolia]
MGLQMNSTSHPLHLCHLNKSTLIINRLYTLFHSIAITILIFYRISSILTLLHSKNQPLIPHLLIFISELTLSFIWFLSQSFLWRPITRTVVPERLPEDDQLPPIDVFICTADPRAEPPLGVMNTVISAMALNYPAEKLSVYLSDDGGCTVTLEAMREALKFAKMWVPFCNKYGVKTVCPEAYFTKGEVEDEVTLDSHEFGDDKHRIKEEYELFAQKVTLMSESESCISNKDHSAVVEVMVDKGMHDQRKMPLLVYVSREKRPCHPHHFKAGSLNVLLRVSSLISNSPYILGLDCDMYCNDKNSAREAMCFHLDPKLSSSLAFVQFPQTFHNISKHDIYESQLRCTFKVGFRYFSVTEDFFTSIHMHSKHWLSVYHMPSRPSFMGSCTTNLNDLLIQGTRWTAGLIEVALSKFSPLIYGPSRMPILQSFCYAWLAFFPMTCISLWIIATVPLLSLLNHITIYPKVRNK